MWFAFNQMRRIGNTSILYYYARQYISEQISKSNTGRVLSAARKQEISDSLLNTLVVVDKNGKRYRTSKDNPDYINGNLTSYRNGYIHSDNTKEKMCKNSGNVGKYSFITNYGDVVYLDLETGNKLNYKKGRPEHTNKKHSNTLKNRIWVNIKETQKDRLINMDEFDETIHVRGRKNGPGFKHINERKK
jgi:hypothetical protein